MISLDIPLLFTGLINCLDDNTLKEIFRKSKEMKSGKFTILETIIGLDFINKFSTFINGINHLDIK